MEHRPLDENKELAAKVATLIAKDSITAEELETYRKQLSFGFIEKNDTISKKESLNLVENIGIWKPEFIKGKKSYIRDTNFINEFFYWSKNHIIPSKSEKFRTVLLGESVARGFLLDPNYNPAIALEKILQEYIEDAEVIDLAKTNCSISELQQITKDCIALQPDAIVIFAGNNWVFEGQISIPDDEINYIFQNIFNEGKFKIIQEIIENNLLKKIQAYFELLSGIAKESNIPIFIINPETNLKNWKSSEIEKNPLFSQNEINEWYTLFHKAKDALLLRKHSYLQELCDTMIQLNPSSPAGYEILAESNYMQGNIENALKYYRLAQETSIFQFSHCPGINSFIQNTIREKAKLFDIKLIDLPLVFSEYLNGDIPGNNLFYDYCHLTLEGINLSMFETAEKILKTVVNEDLHVDKKNLHKYDVDNKNKAISYFLAAIHNAHWGQDFDTLYFYCSKALGLFPDLSKDMILFVSMANSSCPWILNSNFEALVGKGFTQYYNLEQIEGRKTIEFTLCEAIIEALKNIGINISDEIKNQRIKEYSFKQGKIDLLESEYWLNNLFNSNEYSKNQPYYKEINYHSKFLLICKKTCKVNIEITYRVPYLPDVNDEIIFEINGKPLQSVKSSKKWNKEIINLPENLLTEGINQFIIHWPLKNVQNNCITTQNEKGLDLLHKYKYPVIGEIHSLFATCD